MRDAAGLAAHRARPPILLAMAGYAGTLAAVRSLGRAGIPVTVASDRTALPAAWSRWTARRVSCPDLGDTRRFVDWLLEFGARERGHVLYPTSDDLAFIFATHASLLAKDFLLYQPPLATIRTLLDKVSLAEAARAAGIETPVTHLVANDADLERISRTARFPLLIKPRTQVMFRTHNKGVRVARREDLVVAYARYVRANGYLGQLVAEWPDAARPMLQEYYVEAEADIRSVAGFVDESGMLVAARASRKVLQKPRRAGIGICFEHVELDESEVRGISALCRTIGYYGVFEAEFICAGDRRLLIDFNPRFYNQMAFEIARGLPLPLLAYAAATCDRATIDRVRDSGPTREPDNAASCHRSLFWILLTAQRLSRRASPQDVRSWRAWYSAHRGSMIDTAFDREDRLPGLLDVALQLRPALRHPRAFLRETAL